MSRKKRPVIILIAEMLAFALVTLFIVTSGSSSYVRDLFNKMNYPRGYVEYVRKYSYKYGVDENLIFAVIKAESGFDPDAESNKGAVGLMQIMPGTYEGDLKSALSLEKDAYSALRDPGTNVLCGIYYLSHWYNYFGTVKKALAAYNAGPGTVMRWLEDETLTSSDGDIDVKAIPYKQTRRYVQKVLHYYERYTEIYGESKTHSEIFIEREKALEAAKKYGAQYKVDFNLIMAIIETESSFRCYEVSSSGAIGLMQMKADTYRVDVAANLKLTQGADELFEPEFNIMCGSYYLHWLDERLDGINTVAAAYHGGIGTVRGWLGDETLSDGGRLIPEKIPDAATKRYVEKVRDFYEKSVSLHGEDGMYKFDW